jgi:glycosyltransferase involved in cell wall biosynthesis
MQWYPKARKAWIVSNFPKINAEVKPIEKKVGELKMATIALISPMKNHLKVIKALVNFSGKINWDIYGPVKDFAYWELCKREIKENNLESKITYYGELKPELVSETIQKYHLIVQPSESENFGHSLMESLFQGRPIITSHNTPWDFLLENSAGFNTELNVDSLTNSIKIFANMEQGKYNSFSNGAKLYAEKAIDLDEIKQQYLDVFK